MNAQYPGAVIPIPGLPIYVALTLEHAKQIVAEWNAPSGSRDQEGIDLLVRALEKELRRQEPEG